MDPLHVGCAGVEEQVPRPRVPDVLHHLRERPDGPVVEPPYPLQYIQDRLAGQALCLLGDVHVPKVQDLAVKVEEVAPELPEDGPVGFPEDGLEPQRAGPRLPPVVEDDRQDRGPRPRLLEVQAGQVAQHLERCPDGVLVRLVLDEEEHPRRSPGPLDRNLQNEVGVGLPPVGGREGGGVDPEAVPVEEPEAPVVEKEPEDLDAEVLPVEHPAEHGVVGLLRHVEGLGVGPMGCDDAIGWGVGQVRSGDPPGEGAAPPAWARGLLSAPRPGLPLRSPLRGRPGRRSPLGGRRR